MPFLYFLFAIFSIGAWGTAANDPKRDPVNEFFKNFYGS